MSQETVEKKLEQIKALLDELTGLLSRNFDDFKKDLVVIRASERNFQLLVELASDINTQLLLERGRKTPDSYRQSFSDIANIGIITHDLSETLGLSAHLRNILVHEYDFEEDYLKFYQSVKEFLPMYKEYVKTVHKSIK
ncbi:MAG: DUF86 domain-containing protein [Patescibacteria group bacterium]